MDDGVRVGNGVVIPAGELSWRFSRASGPGGQGVNTTDSRVELSFDITATTAFGPTRKARALQRLSGRLVDGVLTIVASEHRSQRRNRQAAQERLAALLAEAIAPPPPPRRPTRPSRSKVRARLDAKTRRARTKSLRRKPTDD